MDRLLQFLLKTFIRRGTFRVTTSRGTVFAFGDGTGQPVSVRFASRKAEWAILLDPELKFGESYMDGTFVVEDGTIADVLAIALGQRSEVPHWARLQGLLRYLWRRLSQFNPRPRAKQNVAHHYDLDGRLYSLFLDADRQYSCAYFERPDATLDDAQLAKRRHLAAKLLIRPRDRVLDIGSGWGGLGLYLAEMTKANITGVTLSSEQFQAANARAAEKNLSRSARFLLQDYRDVTGPFDRIVSVGMFEHVGVDFYETFFKHCADLLAEDGVMLLHSIGRSTGPAVTSPSITKYIFPGAVRSVPRNRAFRPSGVRHRDPSPALCGNAQSLAQTFPGAPRGSDPTLRPAFCADVAVLPRRLGDVVPQAELHEPAGPVDQ